MDSGTALRLQLIKLERNLESAESKQYTETRWKQSLKTGELQKELEV